MQHKDIQGLAPPQDPDPVLAHGIIRKKGGRKEIECKYCSKIMRGGWKPRLKQHLAGERGDVTPCEEVPEEVRVQMKHLGLTDSKISKRQKEMKSSKDSMSYIQGREEGDDGDVVQNKNMVSARGTSKRSGKEIVGRISNRSKSCLTVRRREASKARNKKRVMDLNERKDAWINEVIKFTSTEE